MDPILLGYEQGVAECYGCGALHAPQEMERCAACGAASCCGVCRCVVDATVLRLLEAA